jgi:hypothetical protein
MSAGTPNSEAEAGLARLRGDVISGIGLRVTGAHAPPHAVELGKDWQALDSALDALPAGLAIAYTRVAVRALRSIGPSADVDAFSTSGADLQRLATSFQLSGDSKAPRPQRDKQPASMTPALKNVALLFDMPDSI